MTTDPALSPAEVAALFGCDPRTVTRWCREGRLPHFRTPGGHRRILESDAVALRVSDSMTRTA